MSALDQQLPDDAGRVQPRPRRPLRLSELWLLILALTASIGAFALVGLGMDDTLPTGFWRESLALVGLTLVAHVVIRIKAPYADQVILPAVVLLNGVGLAMIMRIQNSGARLAAGADVGRNTLWSALGVLVACALIWFLKDHRALRKLTYTAMVVSFVLLFSSLVPGIGVTIRGAQRWVNIFGFSIQPAEFVKITLVIFFAGYLVTNKDTLALAGPKVLGLQLPRIRDLGPIILVWIASLAVLILQRDLGTSLLLFGIFVAMLYLATDRISWVLIGMVLFAGGAVAATQAFTHVQQRMTGWLHAMDPDVFNAPGGSFQLVSGLFGMANGGMLGTGWGRGFPYLVPFSFSDFMYTSLAEELGLTGIVAILLVFLVFVERGLRTAITVRDGFGKLLAGGLAFSVAIQVFVVVGGVTRLLPMSGMTLPFMAQGGSSLLSNWLIAALLIRVSDAARRPSSLPMRGTVAAGRIVPDAGATHPADAAHPSTTPTEVISTDRTDRGNA